MVNPNSICILGASFDTGNLGVCALAESSIKTILHRWPDAEMYFVGLGRRRSMYAKQIAGRKVAIETYPIRFSPRIFVADHYLSIFFLGLVFRLLSVIRLGAFVKRHKGTAGALASSDLVVDITGGDSFSDIYGRKRFILGYLSKSMVWLYGKPLVLMPQTYGPYASPLAKYLAKRVLRYADLVLSRDTEGVEYAKGVLGKDCEKVKLCPDVAFVLDSIRPKTEQPARIEQLKSDGQQIVGLNVSGLLYNGGYTRKNQFGLKCDYRALVRNIVSSFARQEDHFVLLVPHVIGKGPSVENDLPACQELWQALPPAAKENVIVLDRWYDQNEVKYLIGLCDFFIGARMHSCIAAISQCIPTVGIAYSKKFAGVFQTAGVEEYVVDMRQMEEVQILDRINELHQIRESAWRQLCEAIPRVQERVMLLFDEIQCLPQSTQSAHRGHRPQPRNDLSADYAD